MSPEERLHLLKKISFEMAMAGTMSFEKKADVALLAIESSGYKIEKVES